MAGATRRFQDDPNNGFWPLDIRASLALLRPTILVRFRPDVGRTELQEPPGESFFGELRRRNVLIVGAAYLVVAWLLIQLADMVFSAATLPAWTVTFVTLVLALGFPVAVLLAWEYEVTPQGIRRRVRTPTAQLRSPQNLYSRSFKRR